MHIHEKCAYFVYLSFCHYVFADQAAAVSNSDHSVSGAALGAELNKVLAESMRDSSQAEESSGAVSEQQPPMTNDRDPSDISESTLSHDMARSDSVELMYEILPVRFSRQELLSSDYGEPIYEISSPLQRSGTSTPQMALDDTSCVRPQAADDSPNVPQVPARPNVTPGVPSPIGSPKPGPRKSSKGHLDVSKLTQVVLPPSPLPNLGSSPAPPVTVPRVPPRLGASQSVSTPSTPVPVVLPRKRSDGQTINHTRTRRLPPPPMPPPVPETGVYHVLGTDDPTLPRTADLPVLPERSGRHQNSVSADRFASNRSKTKRPSVTMLKGYDDKCVEVDSGNPSKRNSKSSLSNATRYVENEVLCLFNNIGLC